MTTTAIAVEVYTTIAITAPQGATLQAGIRQVIIPIVPTIAGSLYTTTTTHTEAPTHTLPTHTRHTEAPIAPIGIGS